MTNLDPNKTYSLSAKLNGKWRSFGNVKVNSYGNWQEGLKLSEEFWELCKEAKANGKEWVNFSFFAKDDEQQKPRQQAKSDPEPLSDEIPWGLLLPFILAVSGVIA